MLLAYGEFDSTTYWGMFGEVLPFLLNHLVPAVVFYVICSAIASAARPCIVGVALYVILFMFLVAPNLGVLGAYGPAHLALDFGAWAYPAFLLLLIAKTFKVRRSQTVEMRVQQGLCPKCAYDLRASKSGNCPECGTDLRTSID